MAIIVMVQVALVVFVFLAVLLVIRESRSRYHRWILPRGFAYKVRGAQKSLFPQNSSTILSTVR